MELSNQCNPPYRQVSLPACLPSKFTLLLLLFVVISHIIAGFITALLGFVVLGLLLCFTGFMVVISAFAYYSIRCHAVTLTQNTQILAQLNNLNEAMTSHNELTNALASALKIEKESSYHTQIGHHNCHPDNDDEVRRLHGIIKDLERRQIHQIE